MQLFANNADSSLNGAIAPDTAVLVLKAGEGDKFPSPTNGDFFLVTLFQRVGTTELNHEIVKCTSRVGDNLTVVRAQEGTAAKAFNSGDFVELRITKESVERFTQPDELATKVDKVVGKGLSTEDYTTAEKSKLAGLQSALDAKAPTATPTITGLREVRAALPANNIDLATGNVFTKTISGATTLTVSNVPATGTTASFILDLTNGGSAAITWWSGVKWAGGTVPTLTAAGRDVLGFFTHDGGTTWTGLVLGKDVK